MPKKIPKLPFVMVVDGSVMVVTESNMVIDIVCYGSSSLSTIIICCTIIIAVLSTIIIERWFWDFFWIYLTFKPNNSYF